MSPGVSGWHRVDGDGWRVDVRVTDAPPPGGRRLWPSVGEYPIYDELLYHLMLQDSARNSLFEQAIVERAPGRTVVELGPGPDLLWSSLAARSGAARVLAVEVLESSARAARERAAELGPHVSVFHGDSRSITLPERGDMCIAELVGAIGGAEGIVAVIDDAWRRHLKPDAVVVPYRVWTRIAALHAEPLLGEGPALDRLAIPYVEQVLRHAGAAFDFRTCLSGLSPADLRTSTDVLEDLEFEKNEAHNARSISLEVLEPGLIDSCVLWVAVQSAPDQAALESLSTPCNWVPVLLPFDRAQAIPVQAGDVLALDVDRSVADGIHAEWSFAGGVRHRDGSWTAVTADSTYGPRRFRASWLHRALLREARQVTAP